MFEYLLITLLILLSLHGYGLLISKIFIQEHKYLSISDTLILSFFSLSFLTTFFHFFISINNNFNLVLHFIGVFLNLLFFKDFKFKINKLKIFIIISLLFLSLIMFYGHNPNEDFGYYHLPYIVNLNSEKIIFGLSALQLSQGWNSMWLNLHSIFYLFEDNYKQLYILNSLFFIACSYFFINEIINNYNKNKYENKILFLYSFVFLIYFIIKFCRVNSYGIDVPGNYILIISILYFLKFILFNEKKLLYFKLFVICLIFSITIRISNIPISLLIFYGLYKIKFNKELIFSKFSIIVILFFSFWTIQQYIYTGCIMFPSKLTCLIEPSWFYESFINEFKFHTYFVNKSFASYTGVKTLEEYHKNFYWIPTWFGRNLIEITEFLIAFLLPVLLLKIFSGRKKFLLKEIKYIYEFRVILLSIIICISVWFYNSPVIRMGNHFIMLLIFFSLYNFNFFHKYPYPFENRKSYVIIFILSTLFFINKNFNRINEINYQKNIWPNLMKVKFETENKFDLNLNRVIQTSEPKTQVCWATKFVCRPGNFNDLVFKRNKYGYLFIFKVK